MEQESNFDALHEHYSFGADAGQEPLRVDKFLTVSYTHLTLPTMDSV